MKRTYELQPNTYATVIIYYNSHFHYAHLDYQ